MAPQLLGWFGPVLLRKHVLDGGSGLHHFVFSSFSATENKILPGAISPPWVCIQLVCHVPQSCSHRCFHNPTRALTLEEWGIFQISLCVVTAHREPKRSELEVCILFRLRNFPWLFPYSFKNLYYV